ncbi:Putative F-box domain-containing protein [Septoria linicola]|uniref:F-box domain-containing protein n=1 Tax=Septoria linicola TaxID=215465 RepID=A0A9Q9END9_9PEZI|nr:Putative F-box domain-containing protein [Septoria linicola]
MALPNLPEELLLHIFTFVEPQELWLSIRGVSKLFSRIIESHLKTSAAPYFVIGVNYTLGAGAHHRWYDVRASVFLSYNSIDRENDDLAFFDKMTVHPEPYYDRAIKKWKEIAATGTDPETMWRVQLRNGNPRTCEMRFIKVPSTLAEQQSLSLQA